MFETKAVEQSQRILCSVTYTEDRAVFEVNMEKHCRNRQVTDDSRTRCVRLAYRVTKGAYTHFECVIQLFYSTNRSMNTPQYYVYTYTDYLICI